MHRYLRLEFIEKIQCQDISILSPVQSKIVAYRQTDRQTAKHFHGIWSSLLSAHAMIKKQFNTGIICERKTAKKKFKFGNNIQL